MTHGVTMNAAGSVPKVEVRQAVRDALARHAGERGALLPVLHAVQDVLGCVPADAVPEIANALNLSRAEVHGVVSYYHHFRAQPPGRHVLQICRAEACQAMDAEALVGHACARLGCAVGETSRDGAVTLEAVYCLGLCASSPAIAIDEAPHARLTPARLDELLAEARSAA